MKTGVSHSYFPRRVWLVTAYACCLLAGASLLVSCSQEEKSGDARDLTPLVSVEGSDTLAELLNAWSAAFMKENPDIPVSFTEGDSGSGVQALLGKTTDVAATSRDLTNRERQAMHEKGLHLKRHLVAIDSIAVIVSPRNKLEEISLSQLQAVFSGKSTDWSSVLPGNDSPIDVLIREPNSGTGRYFTEHVLKRKLGAEEGQTGASYLESARVMTSNDAMIQAVAQNDSAIGFVGLNFALSAGKQVKLLKVKLLETSQAVMPSLKGAGDDYPLSRPLYLFCDLKPKPSVERFVEFCTSEKGQSIARDTGFITLK
ncbi:MAG: PstS family phosphate ABC transporter substrate-binding protein [Candidatus Melainabacteria bacterium]|nr:PstS family phosphate ABC transporter substrate-binding protein [Candidatus Melainabacteria bacterium]